MFYTKYKLSSTAKTMLLVFLAISLLTFLFFQKDYQKFRSYLSGDEPHYIMMTDSLAKDGDFNLKNDYDLGRANSYYAVPNLYPHLSPVIDSANEKWYSIHTIGLPLVSYAPYKLSGVVGTRIWLIAIQFSSVIILYLILKKYLVKRQQIWVGTAVLLASPLFWQNLGGVYPDMIILSIWGATVLLFGRKDMLSNVAIMALLVLSTLLHSKGLVLTGPVVLLHVLWLVRANSFKAWFVKYWPSAGLLFTGVIYYVYFLQSNYGIWNPSQLYDGGDGGSQLFSTNPVFNAIALLTDRNKGLLVHFPLLIVSGLYIYMAFREVADSIKKIKKKLTKANVNHYLVAGLIISSTATLITILSFNDWSGSTAPNGRSSLPLIALVAFLIAKYAKLKSRIEIFVLSSAGLLCVWLSWLSISDFKYYMSTGVNSFWVDRFQLLGHLPIFSLVIKASERGYLIKGAKILILLLAINIVLGVLYSYQVNFKKRSS